MDRRLLISRSALVALGLGLIAGCAGEAKPPTSPATRKPVAVTPALPVDQKPADALPAHVLTTLEHDDAPLAFARRGAEGILLVAQNGHLLSKMVGADGAPMGELTDLGATVDPSTVLAVRAHGDGFVALWTEAVDRSTAVRSRLLDAKGQPRGAVVTVALSTEDVAYIDVLPAGANALVVWEVAHGDRYDVVSAPLVEGKPTRAPERVAQGTLGWEAVGGKNRVTFAAVMPVGEPSSSEAGTPYGRVEMIAVDANGVVAKPVVVSESPTSEGDLALAEVDHALLIAWTDHREIDSAVYAAVVDEAGKLAVLPRRVTAPLGDQGMVSLIGGRSNGRALLAWEDFLQASSGDRVLTLATLDAKANLSATQSTLVLSASGPPDMVADGAGFAAVTLAPATRKNAQPGDEAAPVWPMFVRFGADLSVRASEPVRAAVFASSAGLPYLTRGLSCDSDTCSVLTSGPSPEGPAVALVSLPIQTGDFVAPATIKAPTAPPRVSSIRSVYDGARLARAAATALPGGEGTLVGWLTYVLDEDQAANPGKTSDDEALLGVRLIDKSGALGQVTTISRKAHVVGGMAMASVAGPKGSETTLAWVARDKGKAQVYVTALDAAGQKTAQKALTVVARKPKNDIENEASDVALAALPALDAKDAGELAVVWTDSRDGNAELYAARVDRALRKTAPDKRITDAAGDSVEAQVIAKGKELWIVWTDARDDANGGNGDVFFVRLDARTLQKVGPETKLFSSSAHSRSPVLQATAKGALVAWLEEPDGDDAKSAGVRVAELDERGLLIGVPALVQPHPKDAATNGEVVTSVALACDAACRVAITWTVGEGLVAGGFTYTPGQGASAVRAFTGLSGTVGQDVSPSFSSTSAASLFVADDATAGTGRVRWLGLDW